MQNTMLDSAISNSLQLFQNPAFKVRVIMRDSEPWFVAKDVCDCLEITNVSKACQTLDEDEKGITKVYTLGGSQDMMLISESGLYTLIMRSNKPDAKVFRKWVTSEVLPSIRKTGGYGIRTVDDMINVAKDVATCIEHSNVSKMCELCRDKDKIVESASNFDSNDLLESGNARITLISESGLYRILAKCNLPKCEPFESWVFDEVLPSIRKTGSYSVEQTTLAIPKTLPQPIHFYSPLATMVNKNGSENRLITF